MKYKWPNQDTHFADFLTYQQKNRQAFVAAMGEDMHTVIDIGAHAGSWTIPLASLAQLVYAYEPVHTQTLAANVIESGLDNIQVRGELLSSDSTEKTVWVRTDNSGDTGIDLGSTESRKPITMNSTTLDQQDHRGKISGIKIDVQGHEYKVLLGSEYTIQQHKPVICCELNRGDSQAEGLLKSWGYSLDTKQGKDWIWRYTNA